MSFIHGFLLALGLILPLGVQNMFVFNQGAAQNFLRALPAILTACLCDLLLILIAVLGVSVMVLSFPVVKYAILSIGILFLLYMGFVTWKNAVPSPEAEHQVAVTSETSTMKSSSTAPFSPKKQILFAASVSLLNPHAILDTIGVIGTSSLQYQGLDKVLFSGACILVSFLWFFFLALAGRWVGQISQGLLPIINRISAVIMWGSAFYLLKSFL